MMRVGIFAVTLLMAETALACSCMPGTREDTIANADLVIEGTVLSTEESAMVVKAPVKVHQYIKGSGDEVITIQTANQSAACGVKLATGQKGEFAVHTHDGVHRISSCSQWSLHNRAQDTPKIEP